MRVPDLSRWTLSAILLLASSSPASNLPAPSLPAAWTLQAQPGLPRHPSAIQPSALRPFTPQRPRVFRVGDRARLLVIEDHELPLIDGVIAFQGGSAYDTEQKVGTARLLAELLRSGGSLECSGNDIDLWLDRHGASLSITSRRDQLRIDFSCHPHDLETLLEMIRELIHEPAYPDRSLAKARSRILAEIARRRDDGAALADQALLHLIHGLDSPFAREPDEETLSRVTRTDLIACHSTYLTTNGLVAGLVGDVEPELASRLVTACLRGLASGDRPELVPPNFDQPSETLIYVIDRPESTQTELRIAGPGVRRRNQDFAALRIWSWVVGVGGMTNRMMVRVRTELGLAYSVGAVYRGGWSQPGYLRGVCGTRNEAVGEALQAMLEVIGGGLGEIPEDELDAARQRLLNADVFSLENPRKLLERAVSLAFYDYPNNFWERHNDRLRKLDAPTVAVAVERHLDPSRLVIVAVGPAREIIPQLEHLGPVTLVDSRGRSPRTDDLEEGALQRLFNAVGESERWRTLEWIEWEEVATLTRHDGQTSKIQVHHWRSLERPLLRIEQTIGTTTTLSIVNGTEGWLRTPTGWIDMPAEQAGRLVQGTERSLFRLLHLLAQPGSSCWKEDDQSGRLHFLRRDGGTLCWMELDEAGFPSRTGVDGEQPLLFEYGEWTQKDGLYYPGETRQSNSLTTTVKSFTARTKIPPELFERK